MLWACVRARVCTYLCFAQYMYMDAIVLDVDVDVDDLLCLGKKS